MKLPIFIVDAFTSTAFGGNPAAVCLLTKDISDDLKQKIASEMNLSETAFLLPLDHEGEEAFRVGSRFQLRWFTPMTEVPLCGHATLASAAVLFDRTANKNPKLFFETLKSGVLTAERKASVVDLLVEMCLPLNPPSIVIPKTDSNIWRLVSEIVGESRMPDVQEVRLSPTMKKLLVRIDFPEMSALETLELPNRESLVGIDNGDRVRGVIVTGRESRGPNKYDFLSRYFAPWVGILEDPVTGSAHTVLGPYWAELLGRTSLVARQCSPRGGELWLNVEEDYTRINGKATVVMEGTFHAPE